MKLVRELVSRGRDTSFALRHRDQPHFAFSWHHHAEWELTWIRAGSGTRFVGDAISPYHDHDLVLLPPDLPHGYWAPATPHQTQRAVIVQFKPELFEHWCQAGPEGAALQRLAQRAAGGLSLTAADGGSVCQALAAMEQSSPLARLGLLLQALAALADSGEAICQGDWRRPADPRIDRACRYVLDHLELTVTAGEVAAVVGMRPDSFARLFRHHTGRSLTAYIHELRIARACDRLRTEPKGSIADIAFGVGFGNLAHFNRLFKRLAGPRQ
jgi:AraC-like DNA-binding protein